MVTETFLRLRFLSCQLSAQLLPLFSNCSVLNMEPSPEWFCLTFRAVCDLAPLYPSTVTCPTGTTCYRRTSTPSALSMCHAQSGMFPLSLRLLIFFLEVLLNLTTLMKPFKVTHPSTTFCVAYSELHYIWSCAMLFQTFHLISPKAMI